MVVNQISISSFLKPTTEHKVKNAQVARHLAAVMLVKAFEGPFPYLMGSLHHL